MPKNNTDAPKNQKRSIIKKTGIFGLIFIAGIAFTGAISYGLGETNKEEFCTSCHSMQLIYEEFKESVHYRNVSGVSATCADCHVPEQTGPKLVAKIMAVKDAWHEFLGTIDTREKFEKHRWAMANRVWDKMRAVDSRECLNCHSFDKMDLSEQDRSARRKHGDAMDNKGKTCIDCHTGIAHEEPEEPEILETSALSGD